MEVLLKAGASVGLANNFGTVPLHILAAHSAMAQVPFVHRVTPVTVVVMPGMSWLAKPCFGTLCTKRLQVSLVVGGGGFLAGVWRTL